MGGEKGHSQETCPGERKAALHADDAGSRGWAGLSALEFAAGKLANAPFALGAALSSQSLPCWRLSTPGEAREKSVSGAGDGSPFQKAPLEAKPAGFPREKSAGAKDP